MHIKIKLDLKSIKLDVQLLFETYLLAIFFAYV